MQKNPILQKHIGFNITMARKAMKAESTSPRAEIIIPVYNALSDLRKCLESIKSHTDGLAVRIIVVNDGSDEETTLWLREYSVDDPMVFLIEHPQNCGYTRAVNTGLKASSAPYVITQNSDTIVSAGWLIGLLACMESDKNIGIVGPLSNAANWQNVPVLRDQENNFAINELPENLSVEDMAGVVKSSSIKIYPRLPIVNGFCFMIRREVIDTIGYMDEESFPIGYGEETDYCIRALDAGYELAIADDVYVYHAKSKSFGHERRKELSYQGAQSLKHKHTPEKYLSRVNMAKNTLELDTVRLRIQQGLFSKH